MRRGGGGGCRCASRTGADLGDRITDLLNLGILAPNDHNTPADADSIDDTLTVSSSAAVTTTTTIATTTSTIGGPTTTITTTTTTPHVCGKGTVEGSETCDDGNAVDEKRSERPAESARQLPRELPGRLVRPGKHERAGGLGQLRRPAGAAGGRHHGLRRLSGCEDVDPRERGSVTGSISSTPPGALNTPNDLNYGLLDAVVSGSAITPGRLFTITFQNCPGAPALAAGDFLCTVKDASNPLGDAVAGVTCSVSVP